MIFFFGSPNGPLEAELAPFKDWEEIGDIWDFEIWDFEILRWRFDTFIILKGAVLSCQMSFWWNSDEFPIFKISNPTSVAKVLPPEARWLVSGYFLTAPL